MRKQSPINIKSHCSLPKYGMKSQWNRRSHHLPKIKLIAAVNPASSVTGTYLSPQASDGISHQGWQKWSIILALVLGISTPSSIWQRLYHPFRKPIYYMRPTSALKSVRQNQQELSSWLQIHIHLNPNLTYSGYKCMLLVWKLVPLLVTSHKTFSVISRSGFTGGRMEGCTPCCLYPVSTLGSYGWAL